MKLLFIFLLIIHAGIHLFGFFKGFNLLDVKELTTPIKPLMAVVWLLVFCLFISTVIVFLLDKYYWPYLLLGAAILSQVIIFSAWTDAKFGTILNIIFLVTAVIGIFGYRFYDHSEKEKAFIIENADAISENSPDTLPPIIKKWIERSGTEVYSKVKYIEIVQNVEMQLKPSQKDWYSGKVDQIFTYNPPAFHWKLKLDIFPLFWIRGRDLYSEGKGSMLILAENVVPLVNVENEEKLNQGSAIRYLAEVALFPYGSLQKNIKWHPLSENSVKAVFSDKGNSYSGIFSFNNSGEFTGFESERYRGVGGDAVLSKWKVSAGKTKNIDGVFLPESLEVIWEIDGKDWTWYKTEIKEVRFNI